MNRRNLYLEVVRLTLGNFDPSSSHARARACDDK